MCDDTNDWISIGELAEAIVTKLTAKRRVDSAGISRAILRLCNVADSQSGDLSGVVDPFWKLKAWGRIVSYRLLFAGRLPVAERPEQNEVTARPDSRRYPPELLNTVDVPVGAHPHIARQLRAARRPGLVPSGNRRITAPELKKVAARPDRFPSRDGVAVCSQFRPAQMTSLIARRHAAAEIRAQRIGKEKRRALADRHALAKCRSALWEEEEPRCDSIRLPARIAGV